MEYLKLFLKGIIVGVANVIPGVSGGTMAVVCNVYDKIIELISFNVKKIISSWKFWLPLVVGMGVGIVAFSKLITFLLEQYSVPTIYFFEGLVAGSIPLILRKAKGAASEKGAKIPMEVACFLVGFAIMILMLVLKDDSAKENATAISEVNATVLALVFVSGVAAAVAMIIPGISGSFLLLALGMYGTIIAAVSDMNVMILCPLALGALVGLFAGAAFVRLLMEKVPSYTYCLILGLVAGSIVTIFPGIPSGVVIAVSAATFALGFSAAYFSSRGEK